ncbi:MAG TPA: helix-turn-helix transcriptional regulator [Longimicrobiales bacterium]|jgi:PadR family transcriptional regulator PadR
MGRDGLLGAFEELVLLAVARGRGDAYGMTVRREIEENTGRDVTIGAVYSTLDRLETKGLVASSLGGADDDRSGRARRHFRIQPGGIEALARARETRSGLWEGIDLADLASDAEAG